MSKGKSSFLPRLVEAVLTKIETELKQVQTSTVSEKHLIELNSIFGSAVLEKALHILDNKRIILFQTEEDNIESLYEISNRTTADVSNVYKIFPNINFCPCNSFKFEVASTNRQYTCEHVLATKLAGWLKKYEIQKITEDQLDFLTENILS